MSLPRLLHRTIAADMLTPVMVYKALALHQDYSFLFESVTGGANKGRYTIMGWQPDRIFTAKGRQYSLQREGNTTEHAEGNPLDFLQTLIKAAQFTLPDGVPAPVAGWFGSLGYECIQHVEPVAPHANDALAMPDIVMIRPTLTLLFDHAFDTITVFAIGYPDATVTKQDLSDTLHQTVSALSYITPEPPVILDDSPPFPTYSSTFTREAYCQAVMTAKEYIAAGDVFQVVPSQRFSLPFTAQPFSFYRALRRFNPSPYLFYLQHPDGVLVGSSPEILVRVQQNAITIRPIAGTRPRGKNTLEDAALAEDLLSDVKERSEHLMLLDLGRNDVGRMAEAGTVHVTDAFFVEKYSHVMHIVSNVTGQLAKGKTALDALMAGFPAGTISGAPKIRAMEIIRELEPCARGFYGGAVGYFSVNGDMDTCIALRTALIKDNTLYVQAGAGVVADSVPELEYQETVNKAKALMLAAAHAPFFDINTKE